MHPINYKFTFMLYHLTCSPIYVSWFSHLDFKCLLKLLSLQAALFISPSTTLIVIHVRVCHWRFYLILNIHHLLEVFSSSSFNSLFFFFSQHSIITMFHFVSSVVPFCSSFFLSFRSPFVYHLQFFISPFYSNFKNNYLPFLSFTCSGKFPSKNTEDTSYFCFLNPV